MGIKRQLRKLLIFSLALTAGTAIVFMVKPVSASTYHELYVDAGEGEAGIQNALDTARNAATALEPYKVILRDGDYTLTSALHIYSNTFLEAGNATIHPDTSLTEPINLLKVGESGYDSASGFYYENITVDGGIWDKEEQGGTAIKVAHAKNFTLQNAKVGNSVDGHLLETAAVDGLTVTGCDFHDNVSDSYTGGGECIQIDILVQDHFNGYENLDDERDYVSDNITVENCTFENVMRAVGSHTGIYGIPYKNVVIKDNTLKEVSDCGFYLCNTQDLTVTGNDISSRSSGIILFNVGDAGTGIYMPSDEKDATDDLSTNGVIKDNTIVSSEGNGIYLNGNVFSGGGTDSDGKQVADGNYYIKGVKVEDNTIKTEAGSAVPVLAEDCVSVSVKNNHIESLADSSYGIYVTDQSSEVSVRGNEIEGPCTAGIRIDGNSTVDRLVKNTITEASDTAIRINEGSAVEWLGRNTIISSSGNDYVINDSTHVENLTAPATEAEETEDGIKVSWDGEVKYILRKDNYGEYKKIAEVTSDDRSYTDTSVEAGNVYQYLVVNEKTFNSNQTKQLGTGTESKVIEYLG